MKIFVSILLFTLVICSCVCKFIWASCNDYLFFTVSESEWDDDDNIAWLKEHDEPWATVLTKWKLSYDLRIRIFSRCSSVFGILTDFPSLQKEYGHELVRFFL